MSIDRQGQKIVIECDSCPETVESEERELWETFWPRCKAEGWKSAKVANEWVHGCQKHGVR